MNAHLFAMNENHINKKNKNILKLFRSKKLRIKKLGVH